MAGKETSHLERVFTSVEENPKAVETTLKGKIPNWLEGSLIRVGPGKYEVGEYKYNHLFDGLAILHKFTIKDKMVTYQSRYLQSDTYKINMANQRITMAEFGTCAFADPCKSIFNRFFTTFKRFIGRPGNEGTDNCSVNILPFSNDEVYCATESMPGLRRFDPLTLETQDKVDWSKFVAVNLATAHPHFDHDGTMYNLGSKFGGRPKYVVIKAPPVEKSTDGAAHALDEASVLATITGQYIASPCYFHSFGMTENYIILLEQPFFINVLKIGTQFLRNTSVAGALDYDKDGKSIFHVIRKDNGEQVPIKFIAPAYCCFHHVNAYEKDNQIIVDFVNVVDPRDILDAMYDTLRKHDYGAGNGEPFRFVLPLGIDKDTKRNENLVTLQSTATAVLKDDGCVYCTGEILCERGFGLPTINYWQNNGKEYRYFYATGLFFKGKYHNGLLKHDIKNKVTKLWTGSDYQYPSEPVFVPAPNNTEEDEGVVLSTVADVQPNTPDFLLVLDGKTFQEIARAEIEAHSVRVPFSFHGQFLNKV